MWNKKKANLGSGAHVPERGMPERGKNATFEAACAKIQQNSEKHLERLKNVVSDDQEQDGVTVEEEVIIEKLTEAFLGSKKETQDHLSNLLSGTLTCLICIENIRHTEATWSCPNCFQILHLDCISKWAKDSLFLFAKAKSDSPVPTTFSCPNCRSQLDSIPQHYVCFCGKERDPEFDKWLCPHSCGSLCGRELRPRCGHHCTLLCHPGPCPPCPKTVQAPCFCGASTTTRRCSQKDWSCAGVCGRSLFCGLHKCPETCHRGECSPCAEERLRKCNCGSSEQRRKCAESQWRCDKLCRRLFDCQLHTCQEKCHKEGDCGACPTAGRRFCPCGRTKYTNLSCTQKLVPTCLNTCEKVLSCGEHRCWNKCHYGDCENCLELVSKTCRCGAKSRQMQCLKSFTCEKKCGRAKPCGHVCTRKCCPPDEQCPPCTIACSRKLNCGIHKCQSLCHNGPCFPCKEQKEKVCPCRKNSARFPCGSDTQKLKVICEEQCQIPPECHHKNRPPHRCHSGRCPPCNLECGQKLPCEHKCPVKCHSAVLTQILPKEKPRKPWEPQPQVRWELIGKPCPPCKVVVSVDCLGRHEVTESPCHLARISSCGRACGRTLPCGQHTCTLECHEVVGAQNDSASGDTCQRSCGSRCPSKSRPKECTHPCGKPCHAGDCAPCNQYMQIRCHCMNTLTVRACKEWCGLTEGERLSATACGQRCSKNLSCAHRCFLKCHPGECGDPLQCTKVIILSCLCKRIKQEAQCGGGTAKAHQVKCDDECRKIKLQNQLLESERKAVEDARRRRQEEERNAHEIERVLGRRKTKNANRAVDDIEFDTNGENKFLIGTGALRLLLATVFVFFGLCLKFYFDVV